VDARFGEGIYDEVSTEVTYHELLARAGAALELGESVVLDASWSRSSWRAAAERLAGANASDLVELRCELPLGVAAQRIETRRALAADASDATPEIAAVMSAQFDAWPGARSISTADSAERSLVAALDAVDTL
jgi:predicted kinase